MAQLRSVLLVDDDADDQELFADALATVYKDADVYQAQDGFDALDVLKHRHPPVPDVIFLDLNMPRKNGMEFLTEMQELAQYRSIPIIVYSTSPQFKEEAKALGAAYYMVKQNSFSALCQELTNVLSKNWPPPAAA